MGGAMGRLTDEGWSYCFKLDDISARQDLHTRMSDNPKYTGARREQHRLSAITLARLAEAVLLAEYLKQNMSMRRQRYEH